jgi:ubiquitin thioesterase protein OTUB1
MQPGKVLVCVDAGGKQHSIAAMLQVPIRVVYLDNSAAPGGQAGELKCDEHDFLPSDGPQTGVQPKVVVLYRPGHYDLLY